MASIPLVLLLMLLVLPVGVDAAELSEKQQLEFFDDNQGPRLVMFEFIRDLCGLSLNRVSKSIDLDCTISGDCTGQLRSSRKVYEADILITPEFRLLFSKSHTFSDSGREIETSTKEKKLEGTDISVVTEELGLSAEEAESLSACVSEVGRTLTEKLIGSDSKNLLVAEKKLSHQDSKSDATISSTLVGLEHARATMSHPSTLRVGDVGLIIFAVIPSLRLHSVMPEVASFDNAEEAKQIAGAVADSRSKLRIPLLEKLGIEGSAKYSKEEWQSGHLVQKALSYQTLSVELKGGGLQKVDITPNKQVLTPFVASRWIWQIEPQKEGPLEFFLALTSSSIEGGEFSHVMSTSIQVEWPITARVKAFIAKNWQWLAGTICIPLVVFWWQRRNKRANKTNSADAKSRAAD